MTTLNALFPRVTLHDQWRAAIRIPEFPTEGVPLFTPSKIAVCASYIRVVFGGRGPYIEIDDIQIRRANLRMPDGQRWRLHSDKAFYHEYRTLDGVMVYWQVKPVTYADYLPGRWYVSPYDLRDKQGRVLINGRPPKWKL